MCREYKTSAYEDIRQLSFKAISNAEARTHIFTDYPAPIIRMSEGEMVLDVRNWGFPPPANAKTSVVNIRNLESPFWRNRLAKIENRCLVPFTQFCEWEGSEAGKKVRRWFSVEGQPIAMFAGIWQNDRFAFLTCEPNELVKPIHPKAMPVVLLKEDYERWLRADWDEVKKLASPFPSQLMSVT